MKQRSLNKYKFFKFDLLTRFNLFHYLIRDIILYVIICLKEGKKLFNSCLFDNDELSISIDKRKEISYYNYILQFRQETS